MKIKVRIKLVVYEIKAYDMPLSSAAGESRICLKQRGNEH